MRPADGGLIPAGERAITNVVLMGMGEPLYNFDNVRDAMDVVADGEGLSLSKRRITLSTSGVVPEIPRWGEEAGSMLAISLHAVRDELRDELVPINRRYPIKELLEACRNYPGLSNARRITFEYVMLKGVNDSIAEAKELVRLLAKIPAKINLIPFNPWPGAPYECSDWTRIEEFAEVVNRAGYASPVQDAARSRHHGGLRPVEVGKRAAAGERLAAAGRDDVVGWVERSARKAHPVRILLQLPTSLGANPRVGSSARKAQPQPSSFTSIPGRETVFPRVAAADQDAALTVDADDLAAAERFVGALDLVTHGREFARNRLADAGFERQPAILEEHPRTVERRLRVEAVVEHVGDDVGVADRLEGAAHDAEHDFGFAARQRHRRDDRMQRPLRRRRSRWGGRASARSRGRGSAARCRFSAW